MKSNQFKPKYSHSFVSHHTPIDHMEVVSQNIK